MPRGSSGNNVYYHESVRGFSDQLSVAINNDAIEGSATSISVDSRATQTGGSGKAIAKGISEASLTTNAERIYINATAEGATTFSYGLSNNSKLILNKENGNQYVRINSNTTFRVYDPAYGLSNSKIIATSGSKLRLTIDATSKATNGAVSGSKAFGLKSSKIMSGAQADLVRVLARHRLRVDSNTSQALVNSQIKTRAGNDLVILHTDQAYIYNQHSLYNSTVDLGEGDDVISLNSGFIGASIIGGEGFDVLETRGLTSQIAFSLFNLKYLGNRKFEVDGHTLSGILDNIQVIKFDDLNYDLTSFYLKAKNWKGSSANDVYNASEKSDKVDGRGGNDRLFGFEGNDVIKGDDGDDLINGGTGRDTAVFSSRDNRINLNSTKWQDTGDGKDRLISIENVNAGSGKDVVTGNKAANTLNGQNGNDRLYGGGGNDLLIGGGGKDRVWGQGGRDTFRVQRGSGYTIIEDFNNGQDRIQLGSGSSGLQLKTRGDDMYLYQRGDLMAIVEDAAGDLNRSGNFLV